MIRERLAYSICVGILFLLVTMVDGSRSWAQAYGEGTLNAVAYRPLPAGRAMRVDPIDNSDRNMILKTEFERQLTELGYSITENAGLIMTFETRDELGSYTSRRRRAFLELTARGGREGGEDARMRFNLFDSNSGGVFNEGKGETSIVTKSQFRMDVTIEDESNGKRLWHAWTIAELGQLDDRALASSMIPVIVKNVGMTVKRQTFSLH